jgi:hypothetical protein
MIVGQEISSLINQISCRLNNQACKQLSKPTAGQLRRTFYICNNIKMNGLGFGLLACPDNLRHLATLNLIAYEQYHGNRGWYNG